MVPRGGLRGKYDRSSQVWIRGWGWRASAAGEELLDGDGEGDRGLVHRVLAGAAEHLKLGVRVDLQPRLLHELGRLSRVVLAGDHLDRDLVALDPGEDVRAGPGRQVGAERLLG